MNSELPCAPESDFELLDKAWRALERLRPADYKYMAGSFCRTMLPTLLGHTAFLPFGEMKDKDIGQRAGLCALSLLVAIGGILVSSRLLKAANKKIMASDDIKKCCNDIAPALVSGLMKADILQGPPMLLRFYNNPEHPRFGFTDVGNPNEIRVCYSLFNQNVTQHGSKPVKKTKAKLQGPAL